MSGPFAARVGGVLSADIAVPEHAREVRFYARVLSTGADPLWREQDLMNNLGLPIIGLGARTPEYADLPLQWMPHIQVADVAAGVRRAQDLGGKALMHARGDGGASQWAVLLDPQGAAFGIIPVVPAGAVPPGTPGPSTPVGCIARLDLTVADAAAACDFYRQVVGWSVRQAGVEDSDYTMLGADGEPAASIRHARGVNFGLPPVWLIGLPVGDLAESLRRVEAEGGKVIQSVEDKDGEHVYAVVQDPVGVHFALVPGKP